MLWHLFVMGICVIKSSHHRAIITCIGTVYCHITWATMFLICVLWSVSNFDTKLTILYRIVCSTFSGGVYIIVEWLWGPILSVMYTFRRYCYYHRFQKIVNNFGHGHPQFLTIEEFVLPNYSILMKTMWFSWKKWVFGIFPWLFKNGYKYWQDIHWIWLENMGEIKMVSVVLPSDSRSRSERPEASHEWLERLIKNIFKYYIFLLTFPKIEAGLLKEINQKPY